MRYPMALIPADDHHGFTVVVPDLEGCVTEGRDLDEAMRMAEEVVGGWIRSALANGFPIHDPSPIERHIENGPDEYNGALWTFIAIDVPTAAA